MKKGLTEMVFILDKSGSMCGYEEDTIGGFNSMIEAQKRVDGEALVSTVLFSNFSRVIHDRKNLKDVQPLTEEDYFVGGSTALIDAIGDAIHHIKNVHKYAREEDVPEKTIFIITTDGYENASYHWSSEQVKKLIAEQEAKGWEFIFLGANIDAVETGDSIGIFRDRCVDYALRDARHMMQFTSDRLGRIRRGEEMVEPLKASYDSFLEDVLNNSKDDTSNSASDSSSDGNKA